MKNRLLQVDSKFNSRFYNTPFIFVGKLLLKQKVYFYIGPSLVPCTLAG